MSKNKAFTLIELLVVIAIIGILATLTIVSLQQARQNARNAKRVADLRQMQTALALYFNDNSRYPDVSEFVLGEELISSSTGKILMHQIPSAPAVADGDCLASDYTYTVNTDNSSYKLTTCISKDINDLPSGIITATPNSLGYLDACNNQTEFTDQRDGTAYQIVAIGDQCWMAENLKYLPENVIVSNPANGDLSNHHYYIYGFTGGSVQDAKLELNYQNNGVLYNHSAALISCPDGWRLATDEEWNILERLVVDLIDSPNEQYPCSTSETTWQRCADNVGGNSGANGVGQALKILGVGSGAGAGTDLVGFSAKVSGIREDGFFTYLNLYGFYWAMDSGSSLSAWSRRFYYNASTIARYLDSKVEGFSVRCLKAN